ncbi:MAG: hypothetical protein A2075_24335 [Geobacteraceae bacterium GWC2_58_44]|nr:MAG: hypothetical protein A2075_24335 [Geobacteraceae bacterium GWC2_58_44]
MGVFLAKDYLISTNLPLGLLPSLDGRGGGEGEACASFSPSPQPSPIKGEGVFAQFAGDWY